MGQLDADWLSVEFASAEAEVESWSDGLKASLIDHENFFASEILTPSDKSKPDQALLPDNH